MDLPKYGQTIENIFLKAENLSLFSLFSPTHIPAQRREIYRCLFFHPRLSRHFIRIIEIESQSIINLTAIYPKILRQTIFIIKNQRLISFAVNLKRIANSSRDQTIWGILFSFLSLFMLIIISAIDVFYVMLLFQYDMITPMFRNFLKARLGYLLDNM